jgi:uncharacterized membrane protein
MIWRLKNIANQTIIIQQGSNEKIVNTAILRNINWLYYKGLFFSGIIGAIAVLIYYLPIDLFPAFFSKFTFNLSFFGFSVEFKLINIIFNIFCLLLELYFLGILNIYLINRLSRLINFPKEGDKFSEFHLNELKQISLENFKSKESELGLNPFYGLSKFYIFFQIIVSKIKAFASNLIIKMVVRKLSGRYLLRLYTDLLSMPIYFFWNAYATRFVFLRAKSYMFSHAIIDRFLVEFKTKYEGNEQVKKMVYEVLAQIAITKRELHSVQYYFSYRILKDLEIDVYKSYVPSDNFIDLLKEYDIDIVDDLVILYLIGIISDGELNRREVRLMDKLIETFKLDNELIKKYKEFAKNYKKGRGVEFYEEKSN